MSFIPDLSVIAAFAAAAFILAITPGPDMALQMSRAINHGFWHGIAVGLLGLERQGRARDDQTGEKQRQQAHCGSPRGSIPAIACRRMLE